MSPRTSSILEKVTGSIYIITGSFSPIKFGILAFILPPPIKLVKLVTLIGVIAYKHLSKTFVKLKSQKLINIKPMFFKAYV